ERAALLGFAGIQEVVLSQPVPGQGDCRNRRRVFSGAGLTWRKGRETQCESEQERSFHGNRRMRGKFAGGKFFIPFHVGASLSGRFAGTRRHSDWAESFSRVNQPSASSRPVESPCFSMPRAPIRSAMLRKRLVNGTGLVLT